MNDEEARLYYGEECYDLIKKIYEFCRESDYVIYQHATDLESANDIMQKGFIVQSAEIDDIPTEVLENMPIAFEYDNNRIRTSIYIGGQCEVRLSGIRDELDDTQHFFENTYCNLDFDSLSNPDVNRSGFGATCLFVVPKYLTGSREYIQYGVTDAHFDDWENRQIPKTCFERRVIPTQFCIGYLDVINKRFIANPSFQFNYGVTDEFALGTTTTSQRDLSSELDKSSRKK